MMLVKKSENDLRRVGLTRSLVPARHSAGRGAMLSWMNCRPLVQSGAKEDLCLRTNSEWQMVELVTERGWWCLV